MQKKKIFLTNGIINSNSFAAYIYINVCLCMVLIGIVFNFLTLSYILLYWLNLATIALGYQTFTTPVFFFSYIKYADLVFCFSDTDRHLAGGYLQYYFSDLDIHQVDYTSPQFNNKIVNTIFTFTVGKEFILNKLLQYLSENLFSFSTWFPMLDSSANAKLFNSTITVLNEIEEDIRLLQIMGDSISQIDAQELKDLIIERSVCSQTIQESQQELTLITTFVDVLHLFTTTAFKYIYDHNLFSDLYINTNDVVFKLNIFVNSFKETHIMCNALMHKFSMFVNEGFLNTNLSFSQLNAIYEVINTLIEERVHSSPTKLITQVERLSNKLTLNPAYNELFPSGTLIPTLYKLNTSAAEQIVMIITDNNNYSGTNIPKLEFNNLNNPTTVHLLSKKLQLIDLIKNKVLVAGELIDHMIVIHQSNVVQVIKNIIDNLKNIEKIYNNHYYFKEILKVISCINEESSSAFITYINTMAGLTTKLWYHLVYVYCLTYTYIPLVIFIILFVITFKRFKGILCKKGRRR